MDVKIHFKEMLEALFNQASGTFRSSTKSVTDSFQKILDQNKSNQNKNNLTKAANKRRKLVEQVIADMSPVLEKLHDYDTKR